MTPEPDPSRGTGPRQEDCCSEGAKNGTSEPSDAGPRPLLDALPESWVLPQATELARRVGARAQRAALQAKARRCDAHGDQLAAAQAYREFARACWGAGLDYGEAIRAATRAIELAPDEPLRVELAERLERIGAHLACAQVLEGSEGVSQDCPADMRQRLASLYHRAGDAETAAMHYAEQARINPKSTDALNRIGTLAGWAPEQVSRERGTIAWHEAARRFKSQGELLGAFEATHRAFELDPASSLTAERLARELSSLGRREAADEVWRQSAVAAGDSARHDVRAVAALDAGDIIGALAAMLDGRSDVTFDMSQLLSGVEQLLSPRPGISRGFDTLLAELGCADWLAVRLEAGPLFERWTDETNCHVALARLESGYFSHLDAAREALVRAIVVQPAQPEARARLSNWAPTASDSDPLLRALVQSARTAQGGLVARQLAGEIVDRVATTKELASLKLWALERIQMTGHLTDQMRAELAICQELVATQNAELSRLQSTWSMVSSEERIHSLQALERKLALDPTRAVDHLAIVVALLELNPLDKVVQSLYVELLDIVARLVISPTRDERLSVALAQAPQLLKDRGCIAQAKFHLRHGQIERALSALLPLLDEATASVRGLFWLFTLARRFRDAYTSARALERVAGTFRSTVRGVFEAIAAELYLEARAPEDALRLSSAVVRTSQNVPRLVTLATRLAEYAEPEVANLGLERALSRVLPNARFCRMLSLSHRGAGEPDIALAWMQRALSLRPGDAELRNQQLELALEVGEPARVVDALIDTMNQALPIFAWVESAASALAWLTSVDPARALSMAKQLLDYVGGANRSLRAALLDAAVVNADEGFAIEVLERAAAVAADSAAIQLALAERRWKNDQTEAGLLAAWRAAQVGASPDTWMQYALVSVEGSSAEAELLRLELLRLLLKQDDKASGMRQALRNLAVARFDLAQDTDGAVEIWRELAESSDGDWGSAIRDMGTVLGAKVAAARLDELSSTIESASERAKLLGLAAQLLQEIGDADAAAALLEKALLVTPESTCLLPLAERATHSQTELERLESLYGTVEGCVLGMYGERSLHYRAARTFEQTEEYPLALRHAALAFEARPDDIAAWNTLVRVSRAARQPQAFALGAMRAVEVARDRGNTHLWLLRAYQQLNDEPEELRLKFDLAIRMLVGVPQVRGVIQVADCVRSMAEQGVEEVDFIRMRFERALESLVAELEGPDGARLGIAIARVAVTELRRFELSSRALVSALKADADLEEFSGVLPAFLPHLAEGEGVFAAMLEQALDWAERPYVQAGREAIALICQLAVAMSNQTAVLRIHQVAERTGREQWLQQWENDELLPGLFDAKDGRAGAIVVAGAWREGGSAEHALAVLEHAAQLFSSQFSSSVDQRAVDAHWQAFCWQYLQAMVMLPVPARLSELRERLSRLELLVPPAVVGELRVELERRSQDQPALCSALAALAFVGTGTPAIRAQLMIEAASIAEALRDDEGALVYYRAAVATQRTSSVARLRLGMLMVRMERHRTKEQAQLLLDVANGLESSVAEELRDVAVFLHAEALDALGDRAGALRLLEEAELQVGPRPLIALLLAEHAVRMEKPEQALGYFAAALGGNWRQLRRFASESLVAARAAAAAGDFEMAHKWLEPALADASVRPEALVLEAELRGVADVVVAERRESEKHGDYPSRPSDEMGTDPASSAVADVEAGRRERLAPRPPSGETVLCENPSLDQGAMPLLWARESSSAGTPSDLAQAMGAFLEESQSGEAQGESGPLHADDNRHGIGGDVEAQRQTPERLASIDGALREVPDTTELARLDATKGHPEEVEPSVSPNDAATEGEPTAPDWEMVQREERIVRESEPTATAWEIVQRVERNIRTTEPTVSVAESSQYVEPSAPVAELPERVEPSAPLAEAMHVLEPSAPPSEAVQAVEPNELELAIAVGEAVAGDPEQLRSWLADGKRWLKRWPLSIRLAELVLTGVRLESHLSHAAALEHVVQVLRGERQARSATELSEQPMVGDALRALLTRGLATSESEALALVWDGAEHEFLMEASDYQVTGVMRVSGTTSPLARAYSEVARRFGIPKTPLFFRRSSQPLETRILLLNPTGALLEGETGSDERVIGYRVGCALWATLPEHSLLFGMATKQVLVVMRALHLAFGSTEQPDATEGEALRLAQVLWQTVRSRSQRRLREICASTLDYERARIAANHALRRAGLYACGDLGVALHAACADIGIEPQLVRGQNWGEVCRQAPELVDLFRFASSAGYADVRWQLGRPAQPVGGGVRIP